MKILIENASEKLKIHVKKHFDDVERGINELNEYNIKRKSGKLKEVLSAAKPGDNKSMNKMFEYMCTNPIRTDLAVLDVKSLL